MKMLRKLLVNARKIQKRTLRRISGSKMKAPDLISFGDSNHHTFFGYYDLSPFSMDDQIILACRVPVDFKDPKTTSMALGYYRLVEPHSFIEVCRTSTWSWQQGARLRWFPTDKDLIIYNSMVKGVYGSEIRDITSGEIIKQYELPLYDISSNGHFGVSLNFSRLQRIRPGYGYSNLPDWTKGDLMPLEDGILLVNLKTGAVEYKLTLDYILKYPHNYLRPDSEHYFNHISFSPDSKKFLFFHLWQNNRRRFSRLLVFDVETSQLKLIENEIIVSHYCWKDNAKIIFTGTNMDGTVGYFLIDIESGERHQLGAGILDCDGHPSTISQSTSIISDTYPDQYQERSIFIFNEKNEKVILGVFYSPFKYEGEFRCDLHPRISRGQKMIAFDSAHSGLRNLYVMGL